MNACISRIHECDLRGSTFPPPSTMRSKQAGFGKSPERFPGSKKASLALGATAPIVRQYEARIAGRYRERYELRRTAIEMSSPWRCPEACMMEGMPVAAKMRLGRSRWRRWCQQGPGLASVMACLLKSTRVNRAPEAAIVVEDSRPGWESCEVQARSGKEAGWCR